MIDFPFSLEDATALAWLVTVTRGAQNLRFTGAQTDITIDGNTWTALPGTTLSTLQKRIDGSVANCTVQFGAYMGGLFQPGELAQGKYDGCDAVIELCDPTNPAGGKATLLIGFVGDISDTRADLNGFEIRGPLTRARTSFAEQFSPNCRADIGDTRCKIPILPNGTTFVDLARDQDLALGQFVRVAIGSADNPTDYDNVYFEVTTAGTTDPTTQPVFDPTIGYETDDGSVVFTTRNAFTRYAQVDSIIDVHTFTLTNASDPDSPDPRAVDDWYTLGLAIIRGGIYDGTSIPILQWIAVSSTIVAFVEIDNIITPGTWLEVIPGCDKTQDTCLNKFNNIVNRRAEPFAPGTDTAAQVTGGTPSGTPTTTAPATKIIYAGISGLPITVPIDTPNVF